MVHQGAWRFENEEGAWQQAPTTWLTLRTNDEMPAITVFEGEGAYAGLTAVALATWFHDLELWQLDGAIFAGDVPPMPDPEVVPVE